MNVRSPKQEIRDLRALFDHLLRRYAWLANNFAMLAPMLRHKQLKDHLFKSNKRAGALLVARALFNACVLDVHTLLMDGDDNNPSLWRLARPFLPKNGRKNDALLGQLASLHYAKNKGMRRQFRRAAGAWANTLIADWGQLRKASKQFDKLRDKWIAHNEVEWDPATGSCRVPELPTMMELFPKLEKVVQIISRSMVHLARILMALEVKQRKFERQIRQNANVFWDLRQT